MAKAWQDAYTIVKTMLLVKRIALVNSKYKLMTVPVRLGLGLANLKKEFQDFHSILFQSNCKMGCPCESYECDGMTTTSEITTTIPTTTSDPTKRAVLLLSTYYSSNLPMVIDFEGEVYSMICAATVFF